jgi:ABC-type polar amino acid transport system ATPase subunit
LIKITNFHKSYGSTVVLKGHDMEISEGEVVANIGPSGSGKSTFLRCINYLEEDQIGTIEIDGVKVDLANNTKRHVSDMRKKTGIVFQNYSLFKNKNALHNVSEPVR